MKKTVKVASLCKQKGSVGNRKPLLHIKNKTSEQRKALKPEVS